MKLRLGLLVLHVGQQCNLRCKNCSNFVPYAPPESLRYPVEQIISDMETLFKVVKKIDEVQVQGGEPLIYSDLPKLLGYLGACREIDKIKIATNGMHLPSEEVLHICKLHNIQIRISDYPQNRKNLQLFAEKAADHDCLENVCLYKFAGGGDLGSFWHNLGAPDEVSREDNNAVVTERFNRCIFNMCLTLADGEIHRCGRGVNAAKVLGFEPAYYDCVKVRNNERFKYDLITYLAGPHFETACRYCNGTHLTNKIPAAEQL